MSAEVPISPSYGVTALFVGQNGELYGLPLLREDSACQKREAWRTASTAQTIAQGRLSDFSYGAVGGAVAAGETPREALRREMVEELGELLHDGVFAQEIINQFVIRTLVRMPSFFY
ncbi:NUDIX domain-containing protein [Candidatus Woesebacteria bacterium]|nr:NUDIX domain-containing protein [Candidatus Woesebacteria bacterium]